MASLPKQYHLEKKTPRAVFISVSKSDWFKFALTRASFSSNRKVQKSIVTRSHSFFCASSQLHVVIWSLIGSLYSSVFYDWLVRLLCFFSS